MNQTQVQNFLQCLAKIDDFNYLALNHHNHLKEEDHDHDHDHDHDEDHDHDHDHDHGDGADLITAKATAMVVLFLASTLCGSIPFILNRYFKWNQSTANARSSTIIKCLLYFGGGVLICTTFLHLLPEVQESVEHLQDCGTIPKLSFPLAELLMCSGFLLMYFIEEIIHLIIHRNKSALEENETEVGVFERRFSSRRSANASNKNQNESRKESLAEAPYSKDNYTAYTIPEKKDNSGLPQTMDHYHHHQHHSHHHHLPSNEKNNMSTSLRGFLIVLALSLHELFEGMAIGLESSSSSVWFMFGAVSAHKLVLAFCVGVELIVAKTKTSLSIIYILTFAVVSPLGIGLGILISQNDQSSAHNFVGVILQGLACGTLLYVVIFEILAKNEGGLATYFALLVGFLVMFGLQQLASHGGHGHSHGGGCGAHDHDDHAHTIVQQMGDDSSQHHMESFEKKLKQLRHASEALLARKSS